MDVSLDDYIVQKGIGATSTGARNRMGFQQGAFTATEDDGVRPLLSIKRFPTFGQTAGGGYFDARQKLSTRPAAASRSINRQLGSGRVVGTQLNLMQNATIADTQHPRQTHAASFGNVTDHGAIQKTKFSDARQRIEMKKNQLMDRGDARMKLLAKRRFGSSEASAGPQNLQTQHSGNPQVTFVPGGPKLPSTVPSLMAVESQPMLVTLSAQGRCTKPGASSLSTVGARNMWNAVGSGDHLRPSSVSVSSGSLRRTFNAQSARSSADYGVELDCERPGAVASNPYKVSIVNEFYEQRPIETIVTPRTPRPAPLQPFAPVKTTVSAAANAAAKTAINAAALSSARTGARPTGTSLTKSVVATKQTAPVSTEPAVLVSPLQGHRIIVSNLHHSVSLDDLLELFSDVGPLKNARLPSPGVADIVFVSVQDAMAAAKMYHTRELDGQPMSVKLRFQPPTQATLQRSKPTIELDIPLLHRALFKTVVSGKPTAPVNFTVQL